jgi:hypothetical protein
MCSRLPNPKPQTRTNTRLASRQDGINWVIATTTIYLYWFLRTAKRSHDVLPRFNVRILIYSQPPDLSALDKFQPRGHRTSSQTHASQGEVGVGDSKSLHGMSTSLSIARTVVWMHLADCDRRLSSDNSNSRLSILSEDSISKRTDKHRFI